MALKKSEIEKFQKMLVALKAELEAVIKGTSETVRLEGTENKGMSQHQADEGTDDFVRSVSIQVSGKELEILRQIDRALEKIEEGTYGKCDATGEEIPIKRLEAVPYATMTRDAQEKAEKGLL